MTTTLSNSFSSTLSDFSAHLDAPLSPEPPLAQDAPASPVVAVEPAPATVIPAQNPARLAFASVLTIALLAVLLLLQGCSAAGSLAASDAQAASGESGMQATAAGLVLEPTLAPTPAPIVYAVGQVVAAAGDVGVYTDAAQSAAIMEIYAQGALFTVMEPGADYASYPVFVDGLSWVRVRAGDGLAGWVPVEGLQ